MNSIIITDLDGTFVKDSISVSPADILKMKKMQEEMLIGVATGRSLKEITYIEEQTGIKFDIKIDRSNYIYRLYILSIPYLINLQHVLYNNYNQFLFLKS